MHRLTLYSTPGRMGKGPQASLLPPSVLAGPGRPHAGAGVAHGAAVHLVPVRGGRAPQAPAGPRGGAHGKDARAHSPRRKVNAGWIGAWCVWGGSLRACMAWQAYAGCLFMSAHSTLTRLPLGLRTPCSSPCSTLPTSPHPHPHSPPQQQPHTGSSRRITSQPAVPKRWQEQHPGERHARPWGQRGWWGGSGRPAHW